MKEKGLSGFFESFLKKETIFLDKRILQSSYTPETIIHRDDQIEVIAGILAPMLKLDKPSNLFIYGKTGTGKTVTVKYITSQIMEVAVQNNTPIRIIYTNCKLKKIADTEYRLIAQLAREFGKAIPPTGLPTDEIYRLFYSVIDQKKQMVLLILDEVDQLVEKTGSDLLYNLIRINEELKNAQVSILGISNDLVFIDRLDPRVRSSLSEEELIFPPYNAIQIQAIIRQRVEKAFKTDVIEPGVIEKCSAYAAREHGDARRALELIRVAGELLERAGREKMVISDIDEAEEVIERDRIVDIISTQPKQFQATLYAILLLCEQKKDNILTGEVYEVYMDICKKTGLRPLTQRRVSDVIAELDMHGIINAKVISKGRYGRTRDINIAIPNTNTPKIKELLEKGLLLR